MKTIHFTLDGQSHQAQEGTSILDYMASLGMEHPYICYSRILARFKAVILVCARSMAK